MKLLMFRELRDRYNVPFTRVHLRRLIAAGEFPAPLLLGARRVAWRDTDIEAWLESRQSKGYAA